MRGRYGDVLCVTIELTSDMYRNEGDCPALTFKGIVNGWRRYQLSVQ